MDKKLVNDKITTYQEELVSMINGIVREDGLHTTAIPTLQLFRASNISEPLHTIYEPSLLVIAQGSKIVTLADENYQYDSTSYLVASVHLPITGQIIQASPEEPYFCVQINFNTEQILDIIKESDDVWNGKKDSGRGIVVNKINSDLFDAVLRLVRLLHTPKDIPVLSPLIIREILYRILQDSQGNLIKQFAMIGSHAHCIAKVIQFINSNFSKPLRIEDLAKKVNMSTSSLHNQFKKVTAMSPLQYQKLIRLQEARRLLFTESSEAANIGFQVGYESPSQFSREYARMFGLPPISDINRLRNSLYS
ncbi:MAG: AraC family transcriptional regulator [Clostridium sp.]|uniref:AraC family transcriptional regulator n=1 Tax=Clostridium sp. TaxID=1506 RepID=UPI0039EC6A22